MDFKNEIHFNAVTFANVNLDPTRRSGWETIATWAVNDKVRLRGTTTYTDARFVSGPYAGNVVPLVSRWSGSAGISWDIIDKCLVFDGVVRAYSSRYLDQDEANKGNFILAPYSVVDVRVGGKAGAFFWSAGIQNLFNTQYIGYGL